MKKNYVLTIADDACNGEEEQFANWVMEKYPNVEASVENVFRSTFTDIDGNEIEEREVFGRDLWDLYCSEPTEDIEEKEFVIIAEYTLTSSDTRLARHTITAKSVEDAENIVMGMCGEIESLEGDVFTAPLPVDCWQD